MIKKKFRTLRFIATLLKILAWFFLLLGVVLFALGIFAAVTGVGAQWMPALGSIIGMPLGQDTTTGLMAGIGAGLIALITSLIYFVIFFAAAETIYLQIDTEHNTRATHDLLERYLTNQHQLLDNVRGTQQQLDTQAKAITQMTTQLASQPAMMTQPYYPPPQYAAPQYSAPYPPYPNYPPPTQQQPPSFLNPTSNESPAPTSLSQASD